VGKARRESKRRFKFEPEMLAQSSDQPNRSITKGNKKRNRLSGKLLIPDAWIAVSRAQLEEKIGQPANFFLDLVLRLRRITGCDSIECPVRRFWGCTCAAAVEDLRLSAGV